MLGKIHETSGNIQKVIEIYEKALKENPDMWVAANNLAFYLSEPVEETQDLEKARQLALKALELIPDFDRFLEDLADYVEDVQEE